MNKKQLLDEFDKVFNPGKLTGTGEGDEWSDIQVLDVDAVKQFVIYAIDETEKRMRLDEKSVYEVVASKLFGMPLNVNCCFGDRPSDEKNMQDIAKAIIKFQENKDA